MPEAPSPLAEPAVLELAVNGRLLAEVQHRPMDCLDEIDTAALVATLRSTADALEEHHLDRPASEVLDETVHSFNVAGDKPSNVSGGE
jgi:hypothetical protein